VTVLKKRKANAFEFSIVAVSFLIGCGYDAYVVDGCASKTVCVMTNKEDYVEEEVKNTRIFQMVTKKDFTIVKFLPKI